MAAGALLMTLWAGPAAATCNAEVVLDFMADLYGYDWGRPVTEEFDATEGPGTREIFQISDDRRREDKQFCVSFYCVTSTEMQIPGRHGKLFFFTWGGSSFHDTNESSVVYSDRLTGETCLVRHRGDTMFKDGAVARAQDLLDLDPDARP